MIRTRIAPSPTGEDLHVGTVATALVNYAWAKKHQGQFIVRIEDTDRTRLVSGAEERMLATLERVGLSPDESPKTGGSHGPYRQSDRLKIYRKYAQELVDKGAAYYCICTPERLAKMRQEQQAKKQIPKYDRCCLNNQNEIIKKIKIDVSYVVRLKIPENQTVAVDDIVRGRVEFRTNDIDDQVLLKSDGFPTYHLAVVVDDYLMKISHVIRAEEWLSSTPKHILLYQAFGWSLPQFAHLSLLRNPDRSKLSKRKNPVWASWYLNQGIFPEALLNYLALMSWSHPDGKEIFDLEEYIKAFDLKDVQKTAPIFDPVKLEWMNGEYIRKLNVERLTLNIINFAGNKYSREMIKKTVPLIQERIKKLSDYLPLCEFFFKKPKKWEIDLSDKKDLFKAIYEELNKVSSPACRQAGWKADIIGETMVNLAKKLNVKNSDFFMWLRVAITGRKITPPLNESMEILGREECLKRMSRLITNHK